MQSLGGSHYFGSADEKSAFHQINMAHGSRGYTAVQVRGHGPLEFLRMPFGLETAPAIYIRAMDVILAGNPKLVAFFDDINHGNATFEGHLEDWRDLCVRALTHNLRLSPKKTYVGFSSIARLGYKVDADGPPPRSRESGGYHVHQASTRCHRRQSSLGLDWLLQPHSFPNYSQLAGPLFDLTARGKKCQGRLDTGAYQVPRGAQGSIGINSRLGLS